MLLENAAQTDRGGRRGEQGAPPSLTSLPAKMPALLAPDALLPPSQGDQGGRVASIGAPDSAATAADASAAVVGPASTEELTVQS